MMRLDHAIVPYIPVIDIFAGPGGLSEGFCSFRTEASEKPFNVKLSIERDAIAHSTLLLRAFFRQFPSDSVPAEYYDFLRNTNDPFEGRLKKLFDKYPDEAIRATDEARLGELGVENPKTVRQWIDAGLGGSDRWILIGGPPCQAYSLAGRSRNKGNDDYVAENDKRQYLYVEYLQIIADHLPTVFIMENVKGLLSATLNDQRVFERICEDLQDPLEALRREQRSVRRKPASKRGLPNHYKLFSLIRYEGMGQTYSLFPTADDQLTQKTNLDNFVVRMEKHGIPQARHRVIILGIREDLSDITPKTLKICSPVSTKQVVSGLPRLRSGLSKEEDSFDAWVRRLRAMPESCLLQAAREKGREEVFKRLSASLEKIEQEHLERGDEFITCDPTIEYCSNWFLDPHLEGVCNHSTRGHMVEDLYRYLYASCFAEVYARSPSLKDFPDVLLPEHANVKAALNGSNFADRFRVQLGDRYSTTITSHIAKDGHYYIHYDPTQCRSFTVREAARLQTFPDNYFFCGPRTSQYAQVGNAVPPLLARQIAEIVFDILERNGEVK